jgi:hypothetical protein
MSAEKKEKNVNKLDFDFTNISGGTHKKTSEYKVKKESNKSSKATSSDNEVRLTFLTKDGWKSKDISNISPNEFLAWAKEVYPGGIDVPEEQLESLSARTMIFNKILHYHMYSPFQMGKNQTGKETKQQLLPN